MTQKMWNFLRSFELVFDDDWEHTRGMLACQRKTT